MTYKLATFGVVRVADGACIPPDPRNRDWQEYQAWLADGGVPDAADPPPAPAVPQRVPAGRFMQALIMKNRLADLEAYINGVPGQRGDILRVLWRRAVEFIRNDPDLIAVAHAVGMTDADIDEVFVLGDSLVPVP